MTRERSRQAESSLGNAVGNFQKILVDFRRVRPPVKTPADLLDDSLVPEGIEALRGQTASYRLGVGKDGGESYGTELSLWYAPMKSYTYIGLLSTLSSDHLSAEPKSDRQFPPRLPHDDDMKYIAQHAIKEPSMDS